MHTILLTHGRHHEVVSGEPHASHEANLPKLIEHAKDLLRQAQQRRGDGLPDGYRILDEQGQEVHAEWMGLI